MIRLKVSEERSARLSVRGERATLHVAATVVTGGGIQHDGPYEVTPTFEEQTLETKDKTMRENVTVLSIPVVEVGNVQGGKTLIIGG